MKSTSTVLAVCLLAVTLALPALARPRGPGHGFEGLSRLERHVTSMELDAATRDAAYAIIDDARAQQRELHGEIRAAHEELRALLDQELPDEGAVFAQADAVGALMLEARKIQLRALLRVRALLPSGAAAGLASRAEEFEPL